MNCKKTTCLLLVFILALSLSSCGLSEQEAILYMASQSQVTLHFDSNLDNSGNAETNIKNYGALGYKEDGILNQSLSFTDGYLEFDNSKALAFENQFTVSMWIKGNDVDACVDPILFGKASSSGELTEGPLSICFYNGYTFLKTDITFKYPDGSYKSYSFKSEDAFSKTDIANSWNNIVVVLDDDSVCYYLNGKLLNQERLPVEYQGYETVATNDKPYFIGRAPIGNYNGYIDEFKFYTYAVTEAEAELIYKEGMQQHENLITLTVDSDEYQINDLTKKMKTALKYEEESECALISAKDIIPAIGGEFSFDKEDLHGRIDITYNGNNYSMWILDTNASHNKTHIKLDTHPSITDDGVVMIPITFISKQLSKSVRFNPDTKQYTIEF